METQARTTTDPPVVTTLALVGAAMVSAAVPDDTIDDDPVSPLSLLADLLAYDGAGIDGQIDHLRDYLKIADENIPATPGNVHGFPPADCV